MALHHCYVRGSHVCNLCARAPRARVLGYMVSTCLAVWRLGLQWACEWALCGQVAIGIWRPCALCVPALSATCMCVRSVRACSSFALTTFACTQQLVCSMHAQSSVHEGCCCCFSVRGQDVYSMPVRALCTGILRFMFMGKLPRTLQLYMQHACACALCRHVAVHFLCGFICSVPVRALCAGMLRYKVLHT